MSKKFFRDIKVIKFCKAVEHGRQCGVAYKPARGSFFARLGYCYVHRRKYYKEWYTEKFVPWFDNQSEETKRYYRRIKREIWDAWVAKYPERRRSIALTSYHKNKDKHAAKRAARMREYRRKKKTLQK